MHYKQPPYWIEFQMPIPFDKVLGPMVWKNLKEMMYKKTTAKKKMSNEKSDGNFVNLFLLLCILL